jgi:hypothetical protein
MVTAVYNNLDGQFRVKLLPNGLHRLEEKELNATVPPASETEISRPGISFCSGSFAMAMSRSFFRLEMSGAITLTILRKKLKKKYRT